MGVANSKPEDFGAFMRQRDAAARAYVCGDGAPVERITPRTGDATFFPPHGGTVQGAEAVAARFAKDVQAFGAEGTSKLDVLQSDSAGDLAFWTGFQNADVTLGGKAMRMKLRVTEVFRFQDGGWKMIHRHADTLAAGKD